MQEAWIGLVGASQRVGVHFLGDVTGGYVHVMTSAINKREFRKKVKEALGELGLDLIEIDDCEPLRVRKEREHLNTEMRKMERTLEKTDGVILGTFHVYSEKSGH